jgi:hypothetical protein
MMCRGDKRLLEQFHVERRGGLEVWVIARYVEERKGRGERD